MFGGLFQKIKKGLTRTREAFGGVIDLFRGRGRVDKDFLAELEKRLYLADVGMAATATIVDRVRQGYQDKEVGEDIELFVRQELRNLLTDPSEGITFQPTGPTVVMIAGVNGSGKTTSIAKLAHRFKADGKKVLIAACDTFRAAAVEQLTIWAERIGCDIVKQQQGSDPAAVAHDACERAKARGATIHAEILGVGNTADAYHITAPHEDGLGAARAMSDSIRNAKLNPDQIDYVNAHGTSTQMGDVAETKAMKTVFGTHAHKMMVSSTKSMIGHLLGASGGVELLATILMIRDGAVHPTINLDNPDPQCDLDYVPHEARRAKVR